MMPSTQVTETLIRRTAGLYQRLGRELGTRPLVLPNAEFFPDTFCGDEVSVKKLLARMQRHAGMRDIPIDLKVLSLGAECDCGDDCKSKGPDHKCCRETGKGSTCNTGGCGGCGTEPEVHLDQPRVVDLGDSWRLQVPEPELRHSVVLTSNLAKSLGLVLLLDTSAPGQNIDDPLDIAAETAAVALGFGGLLLAASYVYSKSCGGPRIAQITKLSCGELAILTALFAAREGHKLRPLRKCLGVTQAEALAAAGDLVSDNPSIVAALRDRPAELSAGHFQLGASKSNLWQRWFGTKSTARSTDLASGAEFNLDELEASLATHVSAVKRQAPQGTPSKHDELRSLVEEALTQTTQET